MASEQIACRPGPLEPQDRWHSTHCGAGLVDDDTRQLGMQAGGEAGSAEPPFINLIHGPWGANQYWVHRSRLGQPYRASCVCPIESPPGGIPNKASTRAS